MTKQIRIPYFGVVTIEKCFGLPIIVGGVVIAGWLFVMWSHVAPTVTFNSLKIEQVAPKQTGTFLTLRLTKDVTWHRLCRSTSVQDMAPTIAADNPKTVSTAPVPIGDHEVTVPPFATRYVGDRAIVVSSGLIAAGRWRYRLCVRSACWPWERWWPIENDCVSTDVDIN